MAARALRTLRLPLIASLSVLLVLILLASSSPTPLQAASPNIVISQVYGGGGNSGATYKNDFIELYNLSSTAVNVTGWSVQYASSAGSSWQVTNLSGTMAPNTYYLVQESAGSGGTVNLPPPDATGGIMMSATAGKVALVTNQTPLTCGATVGSCVPNPVIRDFVGYGGANNYEGTGPTAALTNSTAAIRKNNGATDTDNNNSDFTIGAPNPRNSPNPHGTGSASPSSVQAGNQSTLTVVVTPGPASTGLRVTCDLSSIGGSAAQALADGGSNTFSYLATVLRSTGAGTKTLTCTIADNQGGTNNISITLIVTPAPVHIREVQGTAHISPKNGQAVLFTPAVVTAVKKASCGSSCGYWIQDIAPDADDSTSEGIFVSTGSTNPATLVAVGDNVTVSGTVSENRPGGAGLTVTTIANSSAIVNSHGSPLPAPIIVGTGGRIPPAITIEDDAAGGNVENAGSVFDPASDGMDFWESLEGMLVRINNPVVVGPWKFAGEIVIVGDNCEKVSLCNTARGDVVIRDDPREFNPGRIVLNDAVANLPTTWKVGDHFTGPATGVIDYNFSNYWLEVTSSMTLVPGNPAKETTTLQARPDQLSIATFNVNNLTIGDGTPRFSALAALIVNNLKSPDILAIEEIQDDNGTGTGTVDATKTINALTSAIAAGGPAYQYRQIDPIDNQEGGAGNGNIRVAFLFRTDRGLSFVDRSCNGCNLSTTPVGVVKDAAGVHLSFSPGRVDPMNAAWSSPSGTRRPLVGEFLFKGNRVFVIGNHFKSKGDDPLFGFKQPPQEPTATQRLQQAQVVKAFVDSILALDANANVVVLGDLNDFQFSSTVRTLEGSGLHALINTLPENERFSYNYDGNAQALDHILVSGSLFNRPRQYDIVHVNSEFADQASDHDPQTAGLCVDGTPPTAQVSVSPNELWPANHQYVAVKATAKASDNADPNPAVKLVSVKSNEPDNGLGDGDQPNDIVVSDNYNFKLRAERSGTGKGRVYTITYQVTDACGNSSLAAATVSVPHDKAAK